MIWEGAEVVTVQVVVASRGRAMGRWLKAQFMVGRRRRRIEGRITAVLVAGVGWWGSGSGGGGGGEYGGHPMGSSWR